MINEEISTPPTEVEIMSVLSYLSAKGHLDLVSVVRRLAFQRDLLKQDASKYHQLKELLK